MTGLLRWCLMGLLSLAALGCSGPSQDEEDGAAIRSSKPDAAAIGENNRGVGLMGRFEYEPARAAFASLLERYPDWTEARVNLAIATLNRQEEGDETAALALRSRHRQPRDAQ